MAVYNRQTGVLPGKTIVLYAIFLDNTESLIDTDALPVIYLYDSTVESSVVDEEVAAATYTSAVAGPLTATKLSTGYYSLSYTLPSDAEIGGWLDVWVAEVAGLPAGDILNFSVSETVILSTQAIGNNTMIIIELDASIAGTSGTLLGEDFKLYFSTTYSPLYASPD